jgi:multiple sugar transport system substrate-binding protein
MWYRAKKFLSVITLISMLSVMLAACGGESPTATTGTTGGGTTEATATTATTGGGATEATATTATGGGTTEATATTATGGGTTEATATTGGATTGGGAALQLPANCSNVELAFWNPWTGPDGPHMGDEVNAFNQENPNIKVTMTTLADYYTKLATAAASDQLPDVAIIHVDQVPTWVFRNTIRPIDDLVSSIGLSASDYPAAVWNPGEVAGHRYSIPLDIHPMVMFYNADLLSAAGITEAPKTKDEFEKAAAATTKNGVQGFSITTGFPVRQIFEMLLHQFGGDAWDAKGTQATWNSDAGVQALTWMKDAQSKYSQPKLPVDADLNALKAGQAAMIWNGIWQTTNVTGDAVDFKGMGAPPPQIGSQFFVWAGSHQFTIPVHKSGIDKCKEAASGIFIKYALDHSIEWAKAGQIPALNKVRESADFKNLHPQAEIAAAAEHVFYPPPVPGITDAWAPLDDAVGAIMSGTSSDIKGTLDSAKQRADQILQQNAQRYGTTPNPDATPVPVPSPTPGS